MHIISHHSMLMFGLLVENWIVFLFQKTLFSCCFDFYVKTVPSRICTKLYSRLQVSKTSERYSHAFNGTRITISSCSNCSYLPTFITPLSRGLTFFVRFSSFPHNYSILPPSTMWNTLISFPFHIRLRYCCLVLLIYQHAFQMQWVKRPNDTQGSNNKKIVVVCLQHKPINALIYVILSNGCGSPVCSCVHVHVCVCMFGAPIAYINCAAFQIDFLLNKYTISGTETENMKFIMAFRKASFENICHNNNFINIMCRLAEIQWKSHLSTFGLPHTGNKPDHSPHPPPHLGRKKISNK